MHVFVFDFLEVINCTLPVQICLILAGRSCQRLVSGPTNRATSTHSEDSKVDLFEISDNHYSYRNRHHWSFVFTYASTSSKCILFSIRYFTELYSFFKYPWDTEWIVSEMIDWLKVCDPALIKEISWNPDNWEEPNSRSSTTGSADRLGGRCTHENRRGDSDSEAEGYG
jgi:hypothetical protein